MPGRPMEGVRVVEVAQYTYVPAAGAVLADWGADVIKVEHAVTGDGQRGFAYLGQVAAGGRFAPLMEHPNRGKRSIGLALEHPGALEALYDLVRGADVFVTNFLPDARARLKIDVEHIRAVNPKVIYVRGTALGARGPEADKGGYDQPTFWGRSGGAMGLSMPQIDGLLGMPGPAYGDSIGAMTIAGGISAALFAREKTGEPSIVDVSLLSAGAWANALAIDLSLVTGKPWAPNPPEHAGGSVRNPLIGFFRTSDGRYLNLNMMQPGKYWPQVAAIYGRPEWADDPRFDAADKLMDNAAEGAALLGAEIAARTFEENVALLSAIDGQWAPVQDSVQAGQDPQLRANGYIAEVIDIDGNTRELVTAPVQFDESPATLRRAPDFAEHTEELLREIGRDDAEILKLRIEGAVT